MPLALKSMRSLHPRAAARTWSCRGMLLVALILPAVCGAESLDELELDIYAALIAHGLEANVPILVISTATTADAAAITTHHDDAAALVGELGAPVETLNNWQRRNTRSYDIEHPLDIDVSYQMLSAADRAELFADPEPEIGWTRFFARYPGAPGLLRLSRAGFDNSLTHALVYVEYACGAECGSGRLIYLARAADGWQVRGAALVWMTE